MSSTWGSYVKISIFGESHGNSIGVTIDGLPAGYNVNIDEISLQMSRRAPGRDKTTTPRKETDTPEILSGVLNGKTTGVSLCAIIKNTNTRSQDYNNLNIIPRPGHADFTGGIRYSHYNDTSGGGHFSGRLTAPLVFAGTICREILKDMGIFIGAHVLSIGNIYDEYIDPVNITKKNVEDLSRIYFPTIDSKVESKMREAIENARMSEDSIGGTIECAIVGVPAGIGSPIFGGIENQISSIAFGIPAIKGIEFGDGFAVASTKASYNNDAFYYDENGQVKTRTNHCGGILGGITTGMPIIFRVGIKPTPSISLCQDTVDLSRKENTRLQIHGRHDPCVVPRAVPVIEAVSAIAILESIMEVKKNELK